MPVELPDAALPESGSIADIAARLTLWGRRAPKGLARVEFDSDHARREVVTRLTPALSTAEVAFHQIELPVSQPAAEIIAFLRERLGVLESGVVSITGWATAFSSDAPLRESLRVLNFNREVLAQYPLCQVWWLTRSFGDAVTREIPDLNSWFLIRLRLTENLATLIDADSPSALPASSPEEQNAARHRSADLKARFEQALQSDTPLPDLTSLANAATRELRRAGLGREAEQLSAASVNQIIHTPAYHEYVDGPSPLEAMQEIRFLRDFASLYQNGLRYSEAEQILKKALALTEAISGPEHQDVAFLLNSIAGLYREQGNYGYAEPLYRRALHIQEQILGPQHPATAASLNNLAEIYRRQGAYAQAEPLYRRALAIHENTLGPQHPDTATSLNNLAGQFQHQGQYEEAEPLFQRALAIREQVFGLQHPETATSLNNLAGVHQARENYARAEPLLQEALTIREQTLGPQHPDTAVSLNNLAGLYRARGNHVQAEPLYQRALAICNHVLGPHHPTTVNIRNNYNSLLTQRREAHKSQKRHERGHKSRSS